jgi:hypothetical protein
VIAERSWRCFAVYDNEITAGLVAEFLTRNYCPAEVAARPFPELQVGVQVVVPGELLHRARWLCSQSDVSDAELLYLSTGELQGGESSARPHPSPESGRSRRIKRGLTKRLGRSSS